MTSWFLIAVSVVVGAVILTAIAEALTTPSAEEQEANELLSAIWQERERMERRRMDAAVKVTKGRRG